MSDKELECFCNRQKTLHISCWKRFSYCLCYPIKEKLIELECCHKKVHKSCFESYLLQKRNDVIDVQRHPETSSISLKDISKCLYCQTDPKYPGLPFSYLEQEICQKNQQIRTAFRIICIMMWTLLFCLGITEAILWSSKISPTLENYCDDFKDPQECHLNLKNDLVYKVTMSGPIGIMFLIGLMMLSGIIATMIYSMSRIIIEEDCSNFEKFIYNYFKFWFKIIKYLGEIKKLSLTQFNHNDSVDQYKIKRFQFQKIQKSNFNKLYIPSLVLISQLIYLFLMLSYYLKYLPDQEPKTISEIREVFLGYLPIPMVLNIIPVGSVFMSLFWVIPYFTCCICIIINFAGYGIFKSCQVCCSLKCQKCFNFFSERRNRIRENIQPRIEMFSIDRHDSLKKGRSESIV